MTGILEVLACSRDEKKSGWKLSVYLETSVLIHKVFQPSYQFSLSKHTQLPLQPHKALNIFHNIVIVLPESQLFDMPV